MRMYQSRSFLFLNLILWAGIAGAKTLDDHRAGIADDMQLFGKAPVIVTFKTPLYGALSSEQLPVQLGFARRNFLATLSSDLQASVATQFDYSPAVAMAVTKEQLRELEQNALVDSVHRNGRRTVHLAESVPVVFAGSRPSSAGKGRAIAIIDTGVDRLHPNFSGRVVSEACYSGGGFGGEYPEIVKLCPGGVVASTAVNSGRHCSLSAYEGCDHGTHVAGIAAGNSGVAPGADIIAVQVFTGIRDFFNRNVCGTGRGDSCIVAFDSDITKGLERVYSLRSSLDVSAANMSLGGGGFAGTCNGESPSMTNVINRLHTAGVATTVSSGNGGRSSAISFPACIATAIAIGATSDFTGSVSGNPVQLDKRTFYSDLSSTLDLYAPGTLIRSSVPDGGFANFNGTSMAAPHVAGAFAVIQSLDPSLGVTPIEAAMKSVGPQVTSNGITRRRLAIRDTLQALGISLFNPASILDLLLDEPIVIP